MTPDEFRRFCSARPFRPFTVCLADGQQVRVWHHDFVMISPTGRTASVYERGGALDVIDLLLVTDIKVSAPRKPKRRLGAGARG
jgi:hypothetical protein